MFWIIYILLSALAIIWFAARVRTSDDEDRERAQWTVCSCDAVVDRRSKTCWYCGLPL